MLGSADVLVGFIRIDADGDVGVPSVTQGGWNVENPPLRHQFSVGFAVLHPPYYKRDQALNGDGSVKGKQKERRGKKRFFFPLP